MERKDYKRIVDKHKPKETRIMNSVIAFLVGGLLGIIGVLLTDFYSYYFDITSKDASVFMMLTLIIVSCLFTSLGFFDKWVNFAKCGLIIPTTGFAHSVQSSALDYKKEGFIFGFGNNMLKLAGSVIIYGIISSTIFAGLRYIWEAIL